MPIFFKKNELVEFHLEATESTVMGHEYGNTQSDSEENQGATEEITE